MHNEGGSKRVIVTKTLPGERWLRVLTSSDCRVEVCTHKDTILSVDTISQLIGDKCHGVIGQLTEDWDKKLFKKLQDAGGTAFSNYAVGYNNVNVPDATAHGIPVGNTPGMSMPMRHIDLFTVREPVFGCVMADVGPSRTCFVHAWQECMCVYQTGGCLESCPEVFSIIRSLCLLLMLNGVLEISSRSTSDVAHCRRVDGDNGGDRGGADAGGGAPRCRG